MFRIKSILKYLLLSVLLSLVINTHAQQYPVQGTLAINSPYPAYLSDYANPNIEKLVLNLTLTDLNISNKRVKLKLYIQKQNSAIAQSIDNINGEPTIILDGGVPQRFTSIELANYFRIENLQGINSEAYSQPLPEGVYNISFEVYDYFTGNKLSDRINQLFWLMLNDPPLLNMPRNRENILETNPNNPQIVFQWTPRTTQVTNTEYEFTLSELWDDAGDPYQQFLAAIPKYQITTSNTTLLYGITEPPLLAGRTYAWRVTAKAKAGFEDIGLYRQNGYSEIFIFKYAGQCAAITSVNIEVKGYDRLYINWQPTPNSSLITHNFYKVAYRKYTQSNNWEWHETEIFTPFLNLTNLEASTEYEIKVGGVCNDGLISYSTPQRIKTLQDGQITGINCGQAPVIDLSNKNLIARLNVNDVVMANDFPVTITRVEGGSGVYSGEGWVKIPWLGDIKIKVVFTGIKVNTDKRLIGGFFETTYDPGAKNIGDVDEFIDDLVSLFDDIKELIKNYTGTAKDKKDVADIHIQLTQQYESLFNSPYLTQVQKEDLTTSFNTNDHCFKALEEGKICDSTATNNQGHGPSFFTDYLPPNYDCYKQGAAKLADAMAAAAKAEQEAMQKDFVYTNERGDDNDNIPLNPEPVLGLSPNGKIVANVKLNNNTQNWVAVISKENPFFIIAFDVYEDGKKVNNYTWKKKSNSDWAYYDTKMNALSIERVNENRYVYVYKDAANGCDYFKQVIQWNNNATSENAASIAGAKIDDSKWEKVTLFNADASCFKNFVDEIVTNDNSTACKDEASINEGYDQLLVFVNATVIKDDDLVKTINSVCKSSIHKLTYGQLVKLFKQLASSSSIKEEKEVAILRLMSCISTANYEAFYSLLESENNKLLINLIKRMHDASIYPWDGNNYTNFTGGLCWMFQFNNRIEKIAEDGSPNLLGTIISLKPFKFKTTNWASPYTGNKRFNASYNSSTGAITVFQQEGKIVSGLNGNGGEGWEKIGENFPAISPLSPVIITFEKDELPLVQTALSNATNIGGTTYIVPAIFLKYRSDKIQKDVIEKTGMIALDLVTIYASGGTALAAKVSWARRFWALTEVAGAAGNIGLNTGGIDPNSSLGKALGYYNAAMALIGVKNLGKGLYHFAAKLPERTKDLLKINGNLRELLLAKYLDYRIALTRLQNSDEWVKLSAEAKQEAVAQKKLFKELTDVDNNVNFSWGAASNAFIEGKNADEILEMAKGERPEPETYLKPQYISNHLAKFKNGVVRFTSRTAFEKYGTLGPDGGFVLPKNYLDDILGEANGNLRIVEQKLGLVSGYLSNNDVMIVYIKEQGIVGLRMPSGNEGGTNPLWLPGGLTSGGVPEAVMNFSHKPNFQEIKLK